MSSDVRTEPQHTAPGSGNSQYQQCLRALGSWLDERKARQFTLLETPDDIIVLLEGGPDGTRIDEHHFTRHELLKRDRQMSGKRALILRDEGPDAPDLSLETVGFRDFLRALGAELDEAQAAGVVLIRLQSELVLTYNYVASTEGYFWHKRHVIVDPTSAKRLLTAAHTRRRPPPPKSGLRGLFKRT